MRWFAPLLALSTLTGCAPEGWEGIWFVQMPVLDATACGTDIDENYIDAFAPDGGDPDSEWSFTQTTTLSDSAFFAQVLEGEGATAFVIIDDVVYPGTWDKDVLQVSWSGVLDDVYTEEHDSGYAFFHSEVAELEETLTFLRGEDGAMTGQYSTESNSTIAWSESDRWKLNQVGFYDSQLPSTSYLTGTNPYNVADAEDCNGDDCELTITTTCSGSVDFTGAYAGMHEEGMYASIEDATRDAGAGGSSGPTYY
jgi:hypothetical protein